MKPEPAQWIDRCKREREGLPQEDPFSMAILILIATILLPPLGVAAKHGLGKTTLINLILTLLGFIPGLIHGLYVNYAR